MDPATGTFEHIRFPDEYVANIALGGADLHTAYITLSGTGKLIRTAGPGPGLKLNL